MDRQQGAGKRAGYPSTVRRRDYQSPRIHFEVIVVLRSRHSARNPALQRQKRLKIIKSSRSSHQRSAAGSVPPYLTAKTPLPALQPISRARAKQAIPSSVARWLGAICTLQPLSGTRRAPITARRGACARISVKKPLCVRCAIPVGGTLVIYLLWVSQYVLEGVIGEGLRCCMRVIICVGQRLCGRWRVVVQC